MAIFNSKLLVYQRVNPGVLSLWLSQTPHVCGTSTINEHSYWKWSLVADLSIKNGDVPYFFVCLPEGTSSLHPAKTFSAWCVRRYSWRHASAPWCCCCVFPVRTRVFPANKWGGSPWKLKKKIGVEHEISWCGGLIAITMLGIQNNISLAWKRLEISPWMKNSM